MSSLGHAIADAAERLGAAGIEEPRREARLLLALALGIDSARVFASPDRELGPYDSERFESRLRRRIAREPYSRIAGKREFWSLEFTLSPDTLDPRPDSETLIEAALEFLPDRNAALSVVDFGTGSGALLLALLSELPNACGTGIDISPGAVDQARRNAAALGLERRVRFSVASWGDGIMEAVDVILANPPYIPSADVPNLADEVRLFEPLGALDGGADGLDAYRELAPQIGRLLRPGGIALFEIGAGQEADVSAIMAGTGLIPVAQRKDLAGIVRCLVFESPSQVLRKQKTVGQGAFSL